jgi:hypothetical protein
MDISKQPKLSKTSESHPPPCPVEGPVQSPAFPPITYNVVAASSIGLAEAWISIGLGILLLFIFPNTINYLKSPTQFAQNNTFTFNGNTTTYTQNPIFWTDLGVTVFAAALILEGIALAMVRKPLPLWIAFVVSLMAAVFNIVVIIYTEPINGFPIVCGVGVVILGYMAMTQWRLISALRQ